jgi:sortase A
MIPFSKENYLFWLEKAGIALVAMSAIVFFLTFFPVAREEFKYQLSPRHDDTLVTTREEEMGKEQVGNNDKNTVIYPVDEDFGIVIPKILANAKVIPDVDWTDARVYQRALAEGVAHAEGTSHPDERGNVFIFSHSGVDFYEANRYNALFYLLNKLVAGDEIYLFYHKQKYVYTVVEKKLVSPENIEYLTGKSDKQTLTLMTCSPAGTTFKRLLVIADRVEDN